MSSNNYSTNIYKLPLCSFLKMCLSFSLIEKRETLTERLNGTATTRGIAGEGSRRAPRCKEDDKKTIKLPGGGCYHQPSPPFYFCSPTVLSPDPVLCVILGRGQLWVIPSWAQMFYLPVTGVHPWPCHLLSLSPWKRRLVCPGSVAQLVRWQVCMCSHIAHLIWLKHLLSLKGDDSRGVPGRTFDRNLIVAWAWDTILLGKHTPLVLNHYFNLVFPNMPAWDSKSMKAS